MSGPDSIRWGDLPSGFNLEAGERSAQVIQIDNGKAIFASSICAVICGMCLVGFFWVERRAAAAEKESRLVEYYLMDASSRTPEELKAWAKFKAEQNR